MKKKIRRFDWVDILLGIWLILSPWKLNYAFNDSAAECAIGLGVVLVFFNLISVCRFVDQGQEVFNIMLGVMLIIYPIILNLPIEQLATINVLFVGTIIIIVGALQLFILKKSRY